MGTLRCLRYAQDETDLKSITITTNSPEETQQLGKDLAAAFMGGEVILLTGGLGAGKTCLTQGLAWGLGVQEHARSPTFVLISEYRGRLTLYHVDLYRLDDIYEIEDLGLDDHLGGHGVCVIEWAEKAAPLLPQENLAVTLQVAGPSRRIITLAGCGKRYQDLLERLASLGSKMRAAKERK